MPGTAVSRAEFFVRLFPYEESNEEERKELKEALDEFVFGFGLL